jgi:hypothetical protein
LGDWYYIGHYGQLGPLTREQMDELVEGGVIARETYVWRQGMGDWKQARDVAELSTSFLKTEAYSLPPPPPVSLVEPPPAPTLARPPAYSPSPSYGGAYAPTFHTLKSDRSRVVGGLLQIIPGVGRMYLGYGGYGALQLVLSCFLVGYLWSIIDGIFILSGGVRLDGYGRELTD